MGEDALGAFFKKPQTPKTFIKGNMNRYIAQIKKTTVFSRRFFKLVWWVRPPFQRGTGVFSRRFL